MVGSGGLLVVLEIEGVEYDTSGYLLNRPTPNGNTTESLADTEMKILLMHPTISLTLRLSAFSNIKNVVSN